MLNDANDASNGHLAASGDVWTLACTLYALLFAWADTYNSVVNAYNAHDTDGGS